MIVLGRPWGKLQTQAVLQAGQMNGAGPPLGALGAMGAMGAMEGPDAQAMQELLGQLQNMGALPAAWAAELSVVAFILRSWPRAVQCSSKHPACGLLPSSVSSEVLSAVRRGLVGMLIRARCRAMSPFLQQALCIVLCAGGVSGHEGGVSGHDALSECQAVRCAIVTDACNNSLWPPACTLRSAHGLQSCRSRQKPCKKLCMGPMRVHMGGSWSSCAPCCRGIILASRLITEPRAPRALAQALFQTQLRAPQLTQT